ncbi:MAG: LacI family DNA-binding transcriptional regulator [Bilifractor sp.]
MPATIKDIRAETGLSLATISKYLNGGNVLPRNKEKIDEAVKRLHYHPNEIARGLVTNRTKTIGVIVYNIASIFNGTLLSTIGKELRKRGYGVLICDSAGDTEMEHSNLLFLLNKKVDGIIVVPTEQDAGFLQPARDAGLPMVIVDRILSGNHEDSVTINNKEAAGEAVQTLIHAGHKRIAIICSDKVYTGAERMQGYLGAMRENGLPVLKEYIRTGNQTVDHGYESMRELLALPEPPTAVFMANYDINLGVLMAVNESKYRCPEDVSLFGFDDLLLPRIISPKLYVMKQPMEEMASRCVELLLERIDSKEEYDPRHVVLKASMMTGDSIRKI